MARGPVKLAGDFDACEGKRTKHEADRQRRHFIEGEQDAIDREGQLLKREHK